MNERVPAIDLLRGLSCIGVLLYHIRVDLWIGWWEIRSYPEEYSSFANAMAWLSIPSPFLGHAVLLFFLISGFCIHYPNTLSNTKPNWKIYLYRRFWRIYPTYLIALILTACISYFCYFIWGDTTWNFDRIFRVATLSQNYPPGNGQFLTNPSLWTIPLEVEFYILYPIAFFLFTKSRINILLIITIAVSYWTVYLNNQGIAWPSFTALFLWPSWLLGACVAKWQREDKLSNCNLPVLLLAIGVTLALALLSRLENWASWLQYLAWTGFYSLLFIFCLSQPDLLTRTLGKPLFKSISWLGKISFSLYLLHFPMFKLFGYLHKEIWNEKPANFLISLAYLVPVCFLGWLFFRLVENPIHQWSKKWLTPR